MKHLFFLGVLVAGGSLTGLAQYEGLEPELAEFLIEQEADIAEGDRVLKASLVSIIPTSKRLVVKTVNDEKTLALELSDNLKIKDGVRVVKPTDLKRDDVLVMLLNGKNFRVKEIHKYK